MLLNFFQFNSRWTRTTTWRSKGVIVMAITTTGPDNFTNEFYLVCYYNEKMRIGCKWPIAVYPHSSPVNRVHIEMQRGEANIFISFEYFVCGFASQCRRNLFPRVVFWCYSKYLGLNRNKRTFFFLFANLKRKQTKWRPTIRGFNNITLVIFQEFFLLIYTAVQTRLHSTRIIPSFTSMLMCVLFYFPGPWKFAKRRRVTHLSQF